MFRTVFLAASLVVSGAATGETITAVCRDPVGSLYGQHGTLGHNLAVDETDAMKGEVVTIDWDTIR
jgi:hypothetical protein